MINSGYRGVVGNALGHPWISLSCRTFTMVCLYSMAAEYSAARICPENNMQSANIENIIRIDIRVFIMPSCIIEIFPISSSAYPPHMNNRLGLIRKEFQHIKQAMGTIESRISNNIPPLIPGTDLVQLDTGWIQIHSIMDTQI